MRSWKSALAGAVLPVAAISGAAVAADPSLPQTLAGDYTLSFENSLVSGEHYRAENVLTIAPTGPDAAYVDTSLEFFNGHQCSVSGIAHVEGSDLVYREPETKKIGDDACVLHVTRKGSKVVLSDEGGTCHAYCGARGSLSDDSFPRSSRRPVRHLQRLKASQAFKQALEEDAQSRR